MARLTGLPDAELVSRCLEKDPDAWETLLHRYRRLIASITVKFRLSREDAADIFQAVSIALFRQLPELNKDSKLSSWLITVTVRECWKLQQKSGRSLTDDDPSDAAAETPDPRALTETQMILLERQHQVRMGVEQLSTQCRYLLETLFYSQERPSYVEIAERLAMPVASIGPTRARCLAKLKKILEKIGYP